MIKLGRAPSTQARRPWLPGQPGRTDIADFSVGFDVDADVRAAIITLRRESWVPALNNTTGTPREDADVADITALMKSRVERCGWPKDLTFTVRRTKLSQGEAEHCTLFHINGYKYSCFVTANADLPLQRRDARHRVHARVEDGVRTGKDTGLGHLPSKIWDSTSPGATLWPSPSTCSPGTSCSASCPAR